MKYILFTDIHFGNKSNSDEFNQQCLDFLDFIIDKTKDMDIDGAIFLGDWYHIRPVTNNKTLKYGTEGLYKFGQLARGNGFLILGNHDLYYRDRRDVTSVVIPEGDIGVEVIYEPLTVDNMLFCPWMIKDENLPDLIEEYKPEYVFCHPEIPTFSFNKVTKYDGEYNPADYSGPKRICCGHFHMRQEKNNITYIGNCFSHDFSDSNDWHNKGFAILDTETNEIEYYEWENAPKYCSTFVSKINEIEFGSNMILKLMNDTTLTQVDLNKFDDELRKIPQIKDVLIYPAEMSVENVNVETNVKTIDNINTLVEDLISNMDMENVSNNKLIEIYRELETK